MAATDRTAEIWSTRLQRELLALTAAAEEEDGTDKKKTSAKMEVLPPFVSVQDHTLDLARGVAKVLFRVEVVAAAAAAAEEESAAEGGQEGTKEGAVESEEPKQAEGDAGEDAKEKGDAVTKPNEGEEEEKGEDAAAKEKSDADTVTTAGSSDGGEQEEKKKDEDNATSAADPSFLLIEMDASLITKDDGTVDPSCPMSYPFQKPRAILMTGAEWFPDGSDVHNGDELDVDCDWTPSLHLSDAVANVALRVRESIRRGEPFLGTVRHASAASGGGGGGSASAAMLAESLNLNTKKIGAVFSNISAKGKGWLSAVSDEVAPRAKAADKKEKKVIVASAPTSSTSTTAAVGTGEGAAPREKRSRVAKTSRGNQFRIGDVIDLSEEPWNECAGMYSCKAIRRPVFLQGAIDGVEANKKDEVAGAGFAGAGSMFRSFAQSAKSVMEESFLMITDELITEVKSSRLNVGSGTVACAIPVSSLAKLKFRRQESISLFFKQAPDDPLIFMCPDSAEAVQDIQNVLKRHGVKGKHTNAATQRAIQMALEIVADIQAKERSLEQNPTVENVDEIMNLYRQAAEKFEVAGDARHEEVMNHMHKFLKKTLVASILDGSYAKKQESSETMASTASPAPTPAPAPAAPSPAAPVPEGEVLERGPSESHLDDDGLDPAEKKKIHDETMKNMDDIMEEAKKDLESLGVDDDDLDEYLSSASTPKEGTGEDDHDPVAELDAMLSAADKELADLMNS